ncbi:nitrous oxide-stimulated promoter family protein [Vibrio crassostreae]|uniref:nitrous oxide-stimulated promoter family protein n=1 Tax=Vibrio crassostreae TaxID=246167 RepID=UPI001B310232|nr:nitrous oxide-stimulated promoter family protein [Vibrio crassostreae]
MSNLISLTKKLEQEFKTVKLMVEIYCKAHHENTDNKSLCEKCQELIEYANVRLDRCPYGDAKPTCNKCPIHCYKPEQKEFMRDVMRFSGARMVIPHPILSVKHLLKERQPVPESIKGLKSNRRIRLDKEKNL